MNKSVNISRTIHKDYIAAGSLNATAQELQLLSLSGDSAVRRRVAENSKTPAELLVALALDQDPQVRIAVGLNTTTPHTVLSRLVYDDDPDVRYWLASTSYLPRRLLIELMADPNPFVSHRAESTVLRVQAGMSQRTLTIFDFLEQDHWLLVSRLEKLLEHYSRWPQDHIFDETIGAIDGLRAHFDRQHKFCLDGISNADGLSRELLAKSADDHIQINEKIDALIMMHIHGEPSFYDELCQLVELVLKHIEFAEKELFVELRHVSLEHINNMNVRINQALLSIAV